MNKKILSIIGAVVVAVSAVVGGIIFSGVGTNASGAQMTVSVESPTVEKNNEFKVLVKASSGESMSYVKADLTYNPEKVELVSTSTDLATGANGQIQIIEILPYGETERTYELTFKALEIGATDIRLYNAYIEQYESLDMINVEENTASLEVLVNTSVSEDARIKEMLIAGVSDMDKRFNPDVYEYSLEVGQSMDMFICSVVPMESGSVVSAPVDLTLYPGENHFEILVTAPAGNTQKYVFHIHRLDHEIESGSGTETQTETEKETGMESETASEQETVLETSETETMIETENPATEPLAEESEVVVE